MAISAKSRSRQALIGEADADSSLNDNTPGMHPGHELAELRNAQRQPAGETVIHYTRFAQISSFPDHPEAEPAAPAPAPPMDAAVEKQEDEQKPVRRRVALTCVGSFLFHAGLVVALSLFMPRPPDEAIEDAGEAVSVVVYGDSDFNQTLAGDPELERQPEQVAAEEVEPDTVQSEEATELDAVPPNHTQRVETDTAESVPVVQDVTHISPETVVAAVPEVLVSESPAESFVVQPMATTLPEQLTPDASQAIVSAEIAPMAVQPTEVPPEEVRPVETAEVSPESEEKPVPKPKPKAEKPKPVEKKQSQKKAKPAGGDEGLDRENRTRGVVNGQNGPETDGTSTATGGSDGMGSAAVANYPGKVQKRIRRAVRVPNAYKNMGGSITVRVQLTINGTGRVASVSVARSSGVAELDKAVLDGVRRAAPFPPLPSEWGKASWTFSQEVQVTR
ncbi:hypothetical protein ATY75_22800 [Rhizobium sp. N122]|uniref:cell envelope integrity protein TolA n=1 Tax=Rhizobium sp. N122 TaxID=1764272 RepID=UPI000B5A54B1|nr:energy transducer TonB [Rhizobium sp. N122]OWV86089.1 hypothetical protein ATY75_22800 [Rhizobium sp. N122]